MPLFGLSAWPWCKAWPSIYCRYYGPWREALSYHEYQLPIGCRILSRNLSSLFIETTYITY